MKWWLTISPALIITASVALIRMEWSVKDAKGASAHSYRKIDDSVPASMPSTDSITPLVPQAGLVAGFLPAPACRGAREGLPHSLNIATGDDVTGWMAITDLSESLATPPVVEQIFAGGKVRVRIGKIDVNTEFDVIGNAGAFLNSFGSSGAAILVFPTDPDPAFGGDAFFYPSDHFYVGAGAYDGALRKGIRTAFLGPADLGHSPTYFFIGEAGAKWMLSGGRDGKIAVGAWNDTGTLQRYDGATSNGASGGYGTLDQFMWEKHPDNDDDKTGITAFLTESTGDGAIRAMTAELGGGAEWIGIISGRPDDITGFGLDILRFEAHIADGTNRRSELTGELFYKCLLNPRLSMKPDCQYVHNPGGQSSKGDAVAVTFQCIIDF